MIKTIYIDYMDASKHIFSDFFLGHKGGPKGKILILAVFKKTIHFQNMPRKSVNIEISLPKSKKKKILR